MHEYMNCHNELEMVGCTVSGGIQGMVQMHVMVWENNLCNNIRERGGLWS